MKAMSMLLTAMLVATFHARADDGGTMLILDGSGSMWGQIEGRSKIEIARDVIEEVLAEIDDQRPMGLMAYGHRREADCSDIEILVPTAPGNRAAIQERVNHVIPRGKTPIGDAVLQAARVLEYLEKPATVVLVSDGIENCGVDLCKLAAMLTADGFRFTTHIVGFDLQPGESETLECLSSKTGGLFVAATNANELGQALRDTVLEAQEVIPEAFEETRLDDIVVRGSDVIFLAGRDDVVIPPRGPEHDPGFQILRHGHLEEPLAETFPPYLSVNPGDTVRVLDLAQGGIHFFPQADGDGWGPAGDPAGGAASIDSLGGISGYRGPKGGLLGVFLTDENPAHAAPPATLDFADALMASSGSALTPEIGQIFYVGDGSMSGTDDFRTFNAPENATRLFLGIADGWGFRGAPGYYDDNDGRYTVRIGIEPAGSGVSGEDQ